MGGMTPSVIYQIYPLGAVGAPIRDWSDPGTEKHCLRRLEPWLDHAAGLADTLLLGPIFASATHGYDTLDHFRLDPRLGDEGDLDWLLAACRERDLTLVLDGVFNHVAADHPLASLAARDESGKPRPFEGHEALLELDHTREDVAQEIAKIMCHWLERGIGGWRLDAAYRINPNRWGQIAAMVRDEHPDAWLEGEVIHGDYPAYCARGRLDSVTQYELWKAIWSSIKDGNLFELNWNLKRHGEFLDTFIPQTFIGNHDVERIASTLGDSGAAIAALILATVGGIPSIYAGDEFAFRGVKAEGFAADDPLRPQLPDTPEEAIVSPAAQTMWEVYQWLSHLRTSRPWLLRARTEMLELENTACTYRTHGEGGELTVTIDLEAPSATVLENGKDIWHLPALA